MKRRHAHRMTSVVRLSVTIGKLFLVSPLFIRVIYIANYLLSSFRLQASTMHQPLGDKGLERRRHFGTLSVGKLILRCFLFHSIGTLLTVLHFLFVFRLGRFTNSYDRRHHCIASPQAPTMLCSCVPHHRPTDVIAGSSGCCGDESSHVNAHSKHSRS